MSDEGKKISAAVALLIFFLLVGRAIERKRIPRPRIGKWFGQGVEDITRKSNVFWIVAFTLALIVSTAVPYGRYAWPGGFEEYIAFAAPSAAGIVVGAGIFFDSNSEFDFAGKTYLLSVGLILAGWIAFVCAKPLGLAVFLWTLTLTVAGATAGLIGSAIKTDYQRTYAIEPLFLSHWSCWWAC